MDNLLLVDLIGVETLQRIQDGFADMTGMAAYTTEKDGTPVTQPSNFTDFCMKYTRTSSIGSTRCERCDKIGAQLTMENGGACSYYCHAGLVDFAAPIMANGVMMGSFIGGQILTVPPDLDKFADYADEIGVDREEYVEAVKKIKVVSKERVDRSARFLCIIADALSNIAYQSYQLRLSNIEIEKAAKAKSDFLANMSHEIRTPMNAVLGMAEMALREEMPPTVREYIHQIRSSGKNLLVIINDILDFSKIESGKMDIVPVTYELFSMLNDVASIISSRVGDKDVEFIMDISPDIPTRLYGDNVRIQQILINLLNNAVKFTRQGRVKLTMHCDRINSSSFMFCAEISDTGSGIKEEDMGKLFRSFQQVDSRRNRNIEGTGLGLAISQQLLNLMNGEINVESVYDRGSTFSFKLPQKAVSPLSEVPQVENGVTAALLIENVYVKQQIERDLGRVGAEFFDLEAADTKQKKFDYIIAERKLFDGEVKDLADGSEGAVCIIIDEFNQGSEDELNDDNIIVIRKPVYFLNLYAALGLITDYKREDKDTSAEDFSFTAPDAYVLVVDDNSINLTVAKGLLEPLKMHVDTALSAAETINMVKEKQYDVIFMDHMMPEVDGIEATHLVRRFFPNYSDTPIIALTANAVGGAKEMFLREGMNDFVAKPIDTKDIISKLRKWLPSEKIVPLGKEEEEARKAAPNVIELEHKLQIEGLDVEKAMPMLGNESLYMAVLKEYYLTIDKKSILIEEYWRKHMVDDYAVEVHALKSTSRQIGAFELGSIAEELEHAGKSGNIELIDRKTGAMLEKFRSYKEILEPYFPEVGVEKSKKRVEPIEIMRALDDFQDALDNFDTLAIDEVVEMMSGYRFDGIYEKKFEELRGAADASDIELCEKLVREWKADIASIYINR